MPSGARASYRGCLLALTLKTAWSGVEGASLAMALAT
jgi:hypothetical protein